MTKRQEIEDPASCLNKGPDDEQKFVVREPDIAAAGTVREWCRLRCLYGKNTPRDPQITEALEWADRSAARHASPESASETTEAMLETEGQEEKQQFGKESR